MNNHSILSDQVKSKLLPYQHQHASNLCSILLNNGRGLDLSQTGTGKSYVSAGVCSALNLKPLIICPKSLITMWPKVLEQFGVEHYGIANYEMIMNGKYMVNGKQESCPFVKEVTVPKSDKDTLYNEYKSKKNLVEEFVTFKWTNLPDDMLVIFDEAHRCKNPRTYNTILLHTLAETKVKILLLSATLADKPEMFILPAFVLGFAKTCQGAKYWLSQMMPEYDSIMAGVHAKIFPNYASRMKVRDEDVKTLFPENKIMTNCYEMENAEEIESQYELIEREMKKLKDKQSKSNNVLSNILYARMRIEQLKVPTFLKLARQHLSQGQSVAIFVNFNETMNTLMSELNTTCVIKGSQSTKQRDQSIDQFCLDIEKVIICNIRSGGVGISLHDTIGNRPRVSIISPTWSAQDILQVLGRVYRANAKTGVEQKIIFCKGTIEEQICANMSRKITNIAQLNDGDLLSHKIEGLDQQEHDTKAISTRKIKVIEDQEEKDIVDGLVEQMSGVSISKPKLKKKKIEKKEDTNEKEEKKEDRKEDKKVKKAEKKDEKKVESKKNTKTKKDTAIKKELEQKRKKLLEELAETEMKLKGK